MKKNSPKILIKNAVLATFDRDEKPQRGDILIEGSDIRQIGTSLPEENAEVVDASGLVAMPGFVQTHIHLCQTLFRNLANDLELLDWLRQRIWPLEAAHNRASLAISARLGLLELIKSGTTAILDMGSVRDTDIILQEVANSGLRASVGVTFMDGGEGVPQELSRPAAESIFYFKQLFPVWHGKKNGRIQLNLAPRFALSCSENVLQDIAGLAKEYDLLIHTHASENRKEVAFIREMYGLGNVAYYHKLGLTGKNLCLAHCIWLDDEEVDILAATGSNVLHCPSSNLKLASGIADIPRFLDSGINCSLGADGAPCNNNLNIFWEMRLAGLIQKPIHGPDAMPAKKIIEMATVNGGRTLQLSGRIGSLQIGKKADIILIDLNSVHTVPGDNLYTQLVYAANQENIHSVFIDGKPVMRNRKVLTINEKETLRRANEEYEGLLRRANIQT
ncbi:MAG TPA: 5'-deoxyadenosine deaminase [Bacteroidetes bacterium]|nr:5'-deoxyadenosine deaminase [Bacteroidota bacterium]